MCPAARAAHCSNADQAVAMQAGVLLQCCCLSTPASEGSGGMCGTQGRRTTAACVCTLLGHILAAYKCNSSISLLDAKHS